MNLNKFQEFHFIFDTHDNKSCYNAPFQIDIIFVCKVFKLEIYYKSLSLASLSIEFCRILFSIPAISLTDDQEV